MGRKEGRNREPGAGQSLQTGVCACHLRMKEGWAVQEGRVSGKSSQTTKGLQVSDLGREPPPHLGYWVELVKNASDVS